MYKTVLNVRYARCVVKNWFLDKKQSLCVFIEYILVVAKIMHNNDDDDIQHMDNRPGMGLELISSNMENAIYQLEHCWPTEFPMHKFP